MPAVLRHTSSLSVKPTTGFCFHGSEESRSVVTDLASVFFFLFPSQFTAVFTCVVVASLPVHRFEHKQVQFLAGYLKILRSIATPKSFDMEP